MNRAAEFLNSLIVPRSLRGAIRNYIAHKRSGYQEIGSEPDASCWIKLVIYLGSLITVILSIICFANGLVIIPLIFTSVITASCCLHWLLSPLNWRCFSYQKNLFFFKIAELLQPEIVPNSEQLIQQQPVSICPTCLQPLLNPSLERQPLLESPNQLRLLREISTPQSKLQKPPGLELLLKSAARQETLWKRLIRQIYQWGTTVWTGTLMPDSVLTGTSMEDAKEDRNSMVATTGNFNLTETLLVPVIRRDRIQEFSIQQESLLELTSQYELRREPQTWRESFSEKNLWVSLKKRELYYSFPLWETLTRRNPLQDPLIYRESPPESLIERESPPESLIERESPPESLIERESPPESLIERESPPESLIERESPPESLIEQKSPQELLVGDSFQEPLVEGDSPQEPLVEGESLLFSTTLQEHLLNVCFEPSIPEKSLRVPLYERGTICDSLVLQEYRCESLTQRKSLQETPTPLESQIHQERVGHHPRKWETLCNLLLQQEYLWDTQAESESLQTPRNLFEPPHEPLLQQESARSRRNRKKRERRNRKRLDKRSMDRHETPPQNPAIPKQPISEEIPSIPSEDRLELPRQSLIRRQSIWEPLVPMETGTPQESLSQRKESPDPSRET